jgi:hypothetical protein
VFWRKRTKLLNRCGTFARRFTGDPNRLIAPVAQRLGQRRSFLGGCFDDDKEIVDPGGGGVGVDRIKIVSL